jgi:alpha-galactosidase
MDIVLHSYTVMHHFDALTRRAVFRNVDTRNNGAGYSKVVQRAYSFTLDCEADVQPFHFVKLSGSWARERYAASSMLAHGMQSFGSTRGISGHNHNPFVMISCGPPDCVHGEVKAYSLVYSGNYIFEMEVNDVGRLRISAGMHHMG